MNYDEEDRILSQAMQRWENELNPGVPPGLNNDATFPPRSIQSFDSVAIALGNRFIQDARTRFRLTDSQIVQLIKGIL